MSYDYCIDGSHTCQCAGSIGTESEAMTSTKVGTVNSGYGAVWTLHKNGNARWAVDQFGVILSAGDGFAVAALIREAKREGTYTG